METTGWQLDKNDIQNGWKVPWVTFSLSFYTGKDERMIFASSSGVQVLLGQPYSWENYLLSTGSPEMNDKEWSRFEGGYSKLII